MSPWFGAILALVAVAAGYRGWGWPGVALAGTVIAFWLLLQFSRVLRVMRATAFSPVGRIDSAVMLHSKLRHGLKMLEILQLTRSLGRLDEQAPDTWVWTDDGGASVRAELRGGRLVDWALQRPAAPVDTAPPAPAIGDRDRITGPYTAP